MFYRQRMFNTVHVHGKAQPFWEFKIINSNTLTSYCELNLTNTNRQTARYGMNKYIKSTRVETIVR